MSVCVCVDGGSVRDDVRAKIEEFLCSSIGGRQKCREYMNDRRSAFYPRATYMRDRFALPSLLTLTFSVLCWARPVVRLSWMNNEHLRMIISTKNWWVIRRSDGVCKSKCTHYSLYIVVRALTRDFRSHLSHSCALVVVVSFAYRHNGYERFHWINPHRCTPCHSQYVMRSLPLLYRFGGLFRADHATTRPFLSLSIFFAFI